MIGDREVELVNDAVRSGWVSSIGHYVAEFEQGIASLCGSRHALAVSSGTSALHLALLALRIGPGDEVIVPSLTFVATANAVRYVGATPVFCDSDPCHWCLDAEDLERRVTPRTRAIIPVHLFGHPAQMDTVRDVARRHQLSIVEDAAEALGASYQGTPAGALGDIAIFSFYGNKIITTGEGGALVTDDDALAHRAQMLRDHFMDPVRRYWHEEIGFNFRMTNIQAALGVAQLERLEGFLDRKRAIARRYWHGLSDLPGLSMQREATWARSSWWMTTLLVHPDSGTTRDQMAEALRKWGIDSRPAFYPVHLLPPYENGQRFPVAEHVAERGLSLPSAPSLSEDQQDFVVSSIRALVARRAA